MDQLLNKYNIDKKDYKELKKKINQVIVQHKISRLNSTMCNFGLGIQDMKTCKMIYIHWPGYYPTEESYQYALKNLCPNYIKEKK